jgi:hypothetical protein
MSTSGPVDAFLTRVKRRPVLALPEGPEHLAALLRRVDTPGYAAAVTEGQADEVLKRGHVVPVTVSSSPALPFCAFSVDPTVNGVRMVWQEDDQGGVRAMRLYPLEVDQLATLLRAARGCRCKAAKADRLEGSAAIRFGRSEPGDVRRPGGPIGRGSSDHLRPPWGKRGGR